MVGMLSGCFTGGGVVPGGGQGGSGIRRSGPYGTDPLARSGYGSTASRFGNSGFASGRTFRPSPNVVCDRATETCYRGGEIDASETNAYFGKGASRRVDRIRDGAGTNRIYRVDNDVVCDRRREICYKNGRPDRSETKEFFGKKAARRID